MHIYSLRLWLVMIAIFTGVSAAQADDKCWYIHEWTVTKGQPAGKPKRMSRCLEGTIIKEGDVSVCQRWNRGTTRREMAYFTDAECTQGNLAMGADTAKIPDAKIHDGVRTKKEERKRQREERQMQHGSKSAAGSQSHSPAKNGPATDPNGAGTDPNAGGPKQSAPSH